MKIRLLPIFVLAISFIATNCADVEGQIFEKRDAIESSLRMAESSKESASPLIECKTCQPQREPTEILWIPTIGIGIWYWRKRRKENLVAESEGLDENSNATPVSSSNPYAGGTLGPDGAENSSEPEAR